MMLLPEDEREIYDAVLAVHPAVALVEDSGAWSKDDCPPVRAEVSDCRVNAMMWHREMFPQLCVTVSDEGLLRGPSGYPLVQWLRSREKTPGVLSSGRWAAVFDSEDVEMQKFVRSLFRILFRLTDNQASMLLPGGVTRAALEYRVGPRALGAARAGELRLVSGVAPMIANPVAE
ncbi:hypothetical protein [Actinokineospora sp. NBRC 105648]|uniref:hypothetical protein n=1 Tax=Actinokineospora sp. NBRC 105648 TaxID=3032206 RepID=UPI00255684C7|nr:hypothetical protein [Actinokineospora sp. NBRC 105648]